MTTSQNATRIEPSATLAMFSRAAEMKQQGIDVISLVAGELDCPSPRMAKAAGRQAIDDNFTRYTTNPGIFELREGIAEKLRRDNDLEYSPDQILVSAGAKQATFNLLYSLCGPGDEVIIFSPYFVSYPQQVKMCRAEAKIVETTISDNYQIDPERLRQAVTVRTKLIILNSPSNPTGVVLNRESIEGVARVAVENNLWIISDEIYEKIIYSPAEHYTPAQLVPEVADLTLVVNGFSKAYAMTGWRIGYCAGPVEVIKAAAAVQSHTTSNACAISQKAALAAIAEGDSFVEGIIDDLRSKRDACTEVINSIDGLKLPLSDGTFYLFPSVASYLKDKVSGRNFASAKELALHLLNEHHVALVPGDAFGTPDSVRLSYSGNLEESLEGCRRLKRGLEQLAV